MAECGQVRVAPPLSSPPAALGAALRTERAFTQLLGASHSVQSAQAFPLLGPTGGG
jgi:hypothetical protein